jgi:HIV Tat-specific factor 1
MKSTQIHVAEADSSYKAHKDDIVAEDRPNPKAKSGPQKNSRALAKKKAEEMNSRLADWDDDEPSKMQQTSSRSDKVVVIKGLFTLEGLKSDPDLLPDIQDDLQEEAEKLGTVKNVTVFDMEDDGVATIRFQDAQAARACADFYDGKGYNRKIISASISTGEEKFKKTRKKEVDGEEAEKKRLEEYSKFIEGK